MGLDLEALEIDVELVAGHRRAPGHEEVDAERRRGQLAELADLGPDCGRRLVAGGEESEAPGVADRGGELGRRRPTGERRLDDRVVKLAEDHSPMCPSGFARFPRGSMRSLSTPVGPQQGVSEGSSVRATFGDYYGTSSTYSQLVAVSVFGPPLQVSCSGPPKR